jgi:hypothetical protein
MCVISAFIGDTEATPHLVEMTKVQEIVFGGFYTGIATACGGKLYRKRSIGSFSNFTSENKAFDLPGLIGIAHSRTNDGGGLEWAQPRFDGNESIASVGVGIGGVLGSYEMTLALAESLQTQGATFHTRLTGGKKNGITLSDNSTIHGAEAWLIAIGQLYNSGKSVLESIREVDLRSESVTLYLTAKEPDRIFVANHNSRLVALKTVDGMKLVSSCIGLVESPIWKMEIPPNSFATVTRDSVKLEVLWEDEERFDFHEPHDFISSVYNYITEHPGVSWAEAVQEVSYAGFAENKANLGFFIFHQAIEKLLNDKVIKYKTIEVEGVDGQCGVPLDSITVEAPPVSRYGRLRIRDAI